MILLLTVTAGLLTWRTLEEFPSQSSVRSWRPSRFPRKTSTESSKVKQSPTTWNINQSQFSEYRKLEVAPSDTSSVDGSEEQILYKGEHFSGEIISMQCHVVARNQNQIYLLQSWSKCCKPLLPRAKGWSDQRLKQGNAICPIPNCQGDFARRNTFSVSFVLEFAPVTNKQDKAA